MFLFYFHCSHFDFLLSRLGERGRKRRKSDRGKKKLHKFNSIYQALFTIFCLWQHEVTSSRSYCKGSNNKGQEDSFILMVLCNVRISISLADCPRFVSLKSFDIMSQVRGIEKGWNSWRGVNIFQISSIRNHLSTYTQFIYQ